MELIEAILAAIFAAFFKDTLTPVVEDAVSGKLTMPQSTVTTGYVDPAIDKQVQDAINRS